MKFFFGAMTIAMALTGAAFYWLFHNVDADSQALFMCMSCYMIALFCHIENGRH